MKRLRLIVVLVVILSGMLCISGYSSLPELPNVETQEESMIEEPQLDIFVEAERITGCSAEILRGIAGAESRFVASAVGDNGQSLGMFQLHSRWYDSRVKKYGEFDPFDPADAAIIAGYIIQENLRSFDGNLRLAISAYKRGVAGVNRLGAVDWYVDEILHWRKNKEKVMSFLTFQGITELRRTDDGHFDFQAQAAYQLNDSPAVQIPGRRGGGFPY